MGWRARLHTQASLQHTGMEAATVNFLLSYLAFSRRICADHLSKGPHVLYGQPWVPQAGAGRRGPAVDKLVTLPSHPARLLPVAEGMVLHLDCECLLKVGWDGVAATLLL